MKLIRGRLRKEWSLNMMSITLDYFCKEFKETFTNLIVCLSFFFYHGRHLEEIKSHFRVLTKLI